MKAARSIATLIASAALVPRSRAARKRRRSHVLPRRRRRRSRTPPRRRLRPNRHASRSVVPAEPVRDDAISSASLDDLNKNSPLKPVYFELDSSELSAANQKALDENAALLKRYPSWAVTVEGHCDERGTAEYNLALGERRAIAARAYLVSLGIAADRLRTVSYGKEFPFDPGHDETAFSQKPARAFRHHLEVSL